MDDLSNRRISRGFLPVQVESFLQELEMDFDECFDFTVRVCPRNDREYREQEDERKMIEAALRPTMVGNLIEDSKEHGRRNVANVRETFLLVYTFIC